jgi:hypothetical protein
VRKIQKRTLVNLFWVKSDDAQKGGGEQVVPEYDRQEWDTLPCLQVRM